MNSELPLVSIVTPSFNQSRFIEETLMSVRGQDYSNLEHLVIDGGSTDGTLDILSRYQETYNMRWISEPDAGQSDAVNNGLRCANGEIIGWLNSDDTYMPGAIKQAVHHLQENPSVGWVYGDAYWSNEHGKVLSIYKARKFSFVELLTHGMYLPQPTLFFRHRVLDEIGLLDVGIHTAMDYDFCLRLGHMFDAGYIPAILATRRLHSQAKSAAHSANFFSDAIKALDKFYLNPDLPKSIHIVKKKAYSHCYLVGGYRAFDAGLYREARRLLWQSLILDPRPWRKEPVLILLLFLESWLGLSVLHPGYSRRRAERKFIARHGSVIINWKTGDIPGW